MSTNNNTNDDNTRKRPHNETTTTFQLDNSHHQDGACGETTNQGVGGNKAQENKRRQIILLQSNKNWGLRELLVECGLVEFMNEERDGTFLILYYLVFVRERMVHVFYIDCLSVCIERSGIDHTTRVVVSYIIRGW